MTMLIVDPWDRERDWHAGDPEAERLRLDALRHLYGRLQTAQALMRAGRHPKVLKDEIARLRLRITELES